MKKIICSILGSILLLVCLSSCKQEADTSYFVRTHRDRIGRLCVSLARENKDGERLTEAELTAVYEEAIEVFEKAYLFLSDEEGSALSSLNAPVDMVFDIDKDLIEEINKAVKLSSITDGLYEPCGGALTLLLKEDPSPDKELLADALTHMGIDKIELSENSAVKKDAKAAVDFGAYRDGYALGAVCEHLKKSSIAYGTVTFNGIAGVFGTKSDGELFKVEIGDGTEGHFNISDGYVALVSKNFGTAYDFSDGILTPALEKAVVYSSDPVVSAVVASCGYVYGSDEVFKLYEKKEISFEAMLTERDGAERFTKNADGTGLYTPVTTVEAE